VDVDSKDKYGRTALHFASEGCHAESVTALLEHGSDVNIMCTDNHTPLDYARSTDCCRHLYDSDYYYYYFYDREETLAFMHVHMILERHIVQMKAANLHITEKNL
jgi:hypothetical protein